MIYQKAGIFVALLLLMSGSVFAFAVSSTYYREYPLYVQPGETKEIQMTLQNLASSDNVEVLGQISSGSEVIRFADRSDKYLIPGEGKTVVNMVVSVPQEAKPNDSYTVTVIFTTLATSESGQFGLASSIGKRFDVVVSELELEEKAPIRGEIIFLIVALAVIALVVVVLVAKKAKKGKKKSGKKSEKKQKRKR